MDSSPWQPTNVYKALRNFLISAGLLEPSESGSRSKQMLDIIRTRQGLEPHCHLHLFPLRFFLFLTEWGSCFLWAYSPLQFHSSLVLAFLPLFPFLSFFEKESLCVTPFLAPLCYAVRIVTQWRTESWQWVWSSGSSSVLLVTSTPVLQLFYLGLICQQDQECCGLRLRILPLINAKGGHSLVLCELHWLSLIWQSQKPPGAQRMP